MLVIIISKIFLKIREYIGMKENYELAAIDACCACGGGNY